MSAEPVPPGEEATGPSRRTTLKKGLAVGGAALWAVPAVQALSVTSASAEATSAPPPPPPPPPPPQPTGAYISHGFVLVKCGSKYYAAKVEGDGSVDGSGNQDRAHLVALGHTMKIERGCPPGFVGARTTYEGELALKLVVPATCSIVAGTATSFDGSFRKGGGDKFAPATVAGNVVYFRLSDDD